MDYDNFTSMLKNYAKNKKKLTEAKEELKILFYDMTGVKGVSFDRLPGSFNPSAAEGHKLEQIERYNDKQKDIQFYQDAIKFVESYQDRFPEDLWGMLYDKYVEGKTFKSVGMKHGYSTNGIWVMMKRETEKYL